MVTKEDTSDNFIGFLLDLVLHKTKILLVSSPNGIKIYLSKNKTKPKNVYLVIMKLWRCQIACIGDILVV